MCKSPIFLSTLATRDAGRGGIESAGRLDLVPGVLAGRRGHHQLPHRRLVGQQRPMLGDLAAGRKHTKDSAKHAGQ